MKIETLTKKVGFQGALIADIFSAASLNHLKFLLNKFSYIKQSSPALKADQDLVQILQIV